MDMRNDPAKCVVRCLRSDLKGRSRSRNMRFEVRKLYALHGGGDAGVSESSKRGIETKSNRARGRRHSTKRAWSARCQQGSDQGGLLTLSELNCAYGLGVA
jgi:hypothetical protein